MVTRTKQTKLLCKEKDVQFFFNLSTIILECARTITKNIKLKWLSLILKHNHLMIRLLYTLHVLTCFFQQFNLAKII